MVSPWHEVLGDSFGDLHPRLTTYFSSIPPGCIGAGEGVFATVGTPRWWLRALIRLCADADVLFPVWERNVPFTVTNIAGADHGFGAVGAERVFRFSFGDRTMRDVIMATPEGLVDVLGARRRFRAVFAAQVVHGELHLTSVRIAVRLGRHHLSMPKVLAPKVALTERFSDEDDRQHVSLIMHVPFIGRVYEYAGSFRYNITRGAA